MISKPYACQQKNIQHKRTNMLEAAFESFHENWKDSVTGENNNFYYDIKEENLVMCKLREIN